MTTDEPGMQGPALELPLPAPTLPQAGTFTPAQAAEACRVSVRTVRRWLAAEQLPGAYRTPDGCWHVPVTALTGRLPTGAETSPERGPTSAPTLTPATEYELRLELAVERERRRAAEQLADERGRRADELGQSLEKALRTLEAQTRQLPAGQQTPPGTEPVIGAPAPTLAHSTPTPGRRWFRR